MKTGRKPTTGAQVLELLEQIGPMSAREIADYIGHRIEDIHSAIKVIRRSEECGEPRRLYIKDWEFPQRPHGGRENAVWALGNHRDKKKPERDRAATKKRYEDKRNAKMRAARLGAGSGNHFAVLITQVTR